MKRIEALVGRKVELIGAASGLGAPDSSVSVAPAYLQAYRLDDVLAARGVQARWSRLLAPRIVSPRPQAITEFNHRLSNRVGSALRHGNFPLVLGADHSIAAGTWRGAAEHVRSRDSGALGSVIEAAIEPDEMGPWGEQSAVAIHDYRHVRHVVGSAELVPVADIKSAGAVATA